MPRAWPLNPSNIQGTQSFGQSVITTNMLSQTYDKLDPIALSVDAVELARQ